MVKNASKIIIPTKLILTLDARNVYKDEKKSRIIELAFKIKDNKLSLKIGASNVEVGRMEQIRFKEYCTEQDINYDFVWSNINDVYKITIDKEVLLKLYEQKYCLSIEDLSLIVGYLHYYEDKAFYNICLLDYSEIPDHLQKEYADYSKYEYIAIENKKIYPDTHYKIEIL
jgi:hypothetical protein